MRANHMARAETPGGANQAAQAHRKGSQTRHGRKVCRPPNPNHCLAHRRDRVYLEGSYRGQVNGESQKAFDVRGRYEELADHKYTDTGGIFDIMAVTVIQTHLELTA